MSVASWRVTNAVKNCLSDSDTLKIKPFSIIGNSLEVRKLGVLKNKIDKGNIKVEYDNIKKA